MPKKYTLSPRCYSMNLAEIREEMKRVQVLIDEAMAAGHNALAHRYDRDVLALRQREDELARRKGY